MTPKEMYCRTCLCVLQQHDSGRRSRFYNIFDTLNFAKKLKLCSSIHIEPYDKYPHSVCGTCYEKVLNFYEFQLMCRDSLRMFNEMYDCDNDLEEALGDENHYRNAEDVKEIEFLSDDEYNDEHKNDFPEEHVMDNKTQQDFCKLVDKIPQVKRLFLLPSVGNYRLITEFNDKVQNDHGIDSQTMEETVKNYDNIEANKVTTIFRNDQAENFHIQANETTPSIEAPTIFRNVQAENCHIERNEATTIFTNDQTEKDHIEAKELTTTFSSDQAENCHIEPDQAEKDHIETIFKNASIQRLQSEVHDVVSDVDAVLNEIDVYTTSGNCENFDVDLLELLIQNDTFLQEKTVDNLVNEINDAQIPLESSDTRRVLRSQTIQVRIDIDDEATTIKRRSTVRGRLQISGNNIRTSKLLKSAPQTTTLIDMNGKPNKNCRFWCNICSKYFRFQHCFDAHKRRHEGLPGYPCTFVNCVGAFDHYLDLQEHLNEHIGIPRTIFKCEIENCARIFYRKVALAVHMTKFHKCSPAKHKYECETCGKTFNFAQNLQDHTFIHKDKSTWLYTCDFEGCLQKFRTWTHLRTHKRRHLGIKKFTCPHCGIAKTTAQEIRTHMNTHTSERTWPCQHCTKVCKTFANFRRHTKNKHSGSKRDLKCSLCKATFATIEVLRSHEKRHTADKPHKCEKCDMRFIWAYELKKHEKTHMKKHKLKASKKK